MSRHLTASTSVAAAIQSILAASQNGGGGLDPCSLGHGRLPQGRCVQYLKVPDILPDTLKDKLNVSKNAVHLTLNKRY